jgi:hypothetical protein
VAGGSDSTDQLAIPLPTPGRERREVVAGLDATVQSAFLDIGLVGWTVPALALSVPGILVLIVVALQLIGGAAWLPVARRLLSRTARPSRGDPGRGHRDTPRPGR